MAGIYVLDPVSMVAPSVFLHLPSSPNVPGKNMWMIVFCLFPPMTLDGGAEWNDLFGGSVIRRKCMDWYSGTLPP